MLTADTSNVGFLTGLHERGYLEALREIMRAGQVVYDIGANTGYLMLWLANAFRRRNEELRFVGFEPEPENYRWLLQNLKLNPWARMQCEELALGEEDGELSLWTAGRGDGSTSATRDWAAVNDRTEVKVPVRRLDAICEGGGLPTPDWLVLDVEGFGHHVVAGGQGVIARAKPGIAVEIHNQEEMSGIQRLIVPLGYEESARIETSWGKHVIWQDGARRNAENSR